MFDTELINKIENAKKFFDYYLAINSKRMDYPRTHLSENLYLKLNSKKNLSFTNMKDDIIPFDSEASSDDENQVKLREWLVKCAFHRYSKGIIAENTKENNKNHSITFKEYSEFKNGNKNKRIVSEYQSKTNLIRKIDFLEDELATDSPEQININQINQSNYNSLTNYSCLDINKITIQNENALKITSLSQSTQISNINCLKRLDENYMNEFDEEDIIIAITDEEPEDDNEKKSKTIANKSYKTTDINNQYQKRLQNISNLLKRNTSDIHIYLVKDEDFFIQEWDEKDINTEYIISKSNQKEKNASENKFTQRLKVHQMKNIKGEKCLYNLKYKFIDQIGLDEAKAINSSTNSIYSKFIEDNKPKNTQDEIILELQEGYNNEKDVSKQNMQENPLNKNNKSINYPTQKSTKHFTNNRNEFLYSQRKEKINHNKNNLHNRTISSPSTGIKTDNTISNALNTIENHINNNNHSPELSSLNKEENNFVITLNRKWQLFDQVIYICRIMDLIYKKESAVFYDEDKEYLILYFSIEILKSKNLISV